MNGCAIVLLNPPTRRGHHRWCPLRKKTGKYIRWATDFQVLNSLTVEDSFPTPNISEVLETLGESHVFSTLDAQNGYHCISIEEKSRPLTAFTTALGLYQFVRLVFGLKNAGMSYCRLVSKLIQMLGVEGLLAILMIYFCTPKMLILILNYYVWFCRLIGSLGLN